MLGADTKQWLPVRNLHLSDNSDGGEEGLVRDKWIAVSGVTKCLAEDAKVLEALVDSFMAGQYGALELFNLIIIQDVWGGTNILTTVSSVGNYKATFGNELQELSTKD